MKASPPRLQRAVVSAAAWASRLLPGAVHGLDNIPDDRPLLFVGNHQLLALDVPFLVAALKRECGILLRPLADDFFFRVRPLGWLVRELGAERASVEHCAELMAQGQCILVYPGGAREAAKGRGLPFQLEWWDRLGFARLAIDHDCTVVPVAAAGIDDHMRVVVPPERYLRPPLRTLVDRLEIRHELFPPIVVPRGIPRPQVAFAPPIRPVRYAGHDPDTAARMLRADVASAIEAALHPG